MGNGNDFRDDDRKRSVIFILPIPLRKVKIDEIGSALEVRIPQDPPSPLETCARQWKLALGSSIYLQCKHLVFVNGAIVDRQQVESRIISADFDARPWSHSPPECGKIMFWQWAFRVT